MKLNHETQPQTETITLGNHTVKATRQRDGRIKLESRGLVQIVTSDVWESMKK